jgi:hypothetical protein
MPAPDRDHDLADSQKAILDATRLVSKEAAVDIFLWFLKNFTERLTPAHPMVRAAALHLEYTHRHGVRPALVVHTTMRVDDGHSSIWTRPSGPRIELSLDPTLTALQPGVRDCSGCEYTLLCGSGRHPSCRMDDGVFNEGPSWDPTLTPTHESCSLRCAFAVADKNRKRYLDCARCLPNTRIVEPCPILESWAVHRKHGAVARDLRAMKPMRRLLGK